MLVDQKKFDAVEAILRENGSIERFENEYGEIKGRMMITMTDIPEGIPVDESDGKTPVAFEASFDFYDATVGLAIYTTDRQLATGVWVTPQEDGAEAPAEDWVEFFIRTLVTHIAEDGSFGVPIYSFVNDTCHMTVVPEPPETD